MIEDIGKKQVRAREGLDAVTTLLLARWVRRWGLILGATLLFGLIEPQLMPIFYAALAFAGLMLLVIFGTRRMLANKIAHGGAPVVDAEATEIDEEPVLIDITPSRGDEG